MLPTKMIEQLGEELYNQVNERIGDIDLIVNDDSIIKNDGSYIKNDGSYIKSDDENYMKKEDHEKLINELNSKNDLDSKIFKFLTSSKVRNNKAVLSLLNMDSVKVEDGKLKGLDEQIKALRESDGYLFEDYKPNGFGDDANLDNKSKNNALTKEKFQSMSYKEKCDLYKNDKETYDSLTQE